MKLNSIDELFKDQIKDLYSAESQLIKALPKMAKKASSKSLKEAINSHLEETELQLSRLERIGEIVGFKVSGKTCKAMQGLIEEGGECLQADGDESIIDLAIIAAAQRVEHYEISAYGTARALADQIGLDDVADLLQETVVEEGDADKKLTAIAEDEIMSALSADEDGMGNRDEDDTKKPWHA